jgi:hypothetical protein
LVYDLASYRQIVNDAALYDLQLVLHRGLMAVRLHALEVQATENGYYTDDVLLSLLRLMLLSCMRMAMTVAMVAYCCYYLANDQLCALPL